MRLTIVVPAADRPATLERCLVALRRAQRPSDELIVVGEPPEATATVARNRGAARASGDALVFVDADVEIHGDALERIRKAFENDASLAAVFGSYDDAPEGGVVGTFRNLLHH